MAPPPPSAISAEVLTKETPVATTTWPVEESVFLTTSTQPDAKPLHLLRAPKLTPTLASRAHVKRTLACAFHIFSHYGFDEGVTGHITARDPIQSDCFWVNPFGLHFSLIKVSDLILVDYSGTVIEGRGILNTAAFMIHGEVHKAREDVMCAAHSHSIHGMTWAAMGRELDMLTQDSCAFWKDHSVYDQFGGVVLGQSGGKVMAKSLGSNKAVILQNHGLLTVGQSIEETVFWFISLERCCQAQLLADAAAAGRGYQTVKIGEEEAEVTNRIVGMSAVGYFSGRAMFEKTFKEEGNEFDDE
ncbi:class II aldolase/adducin N-terminal [Terfezia claveryi]|nr:class II aldolase/adducin N-terminal [Terfezia claveryi]